MSDKSSGAHYAIKQMEKNHLIKEKKQKYALTERDILTRCRHPNIIQLHYTFRDEQHLCTYLRTLVYTPHTILTAAYIDYVLDLASNGELFHAIKQRGGLDVPVAQYYSAELLSAIEYLHTHDIIHRDLKPENCLLDEHWHLKLTDFGTAKHLTPVDAPRVSFEGTAEYMAPELLSDDGTQPATRLSDVWALGCIVYQLLTGRVPFHGGTEYQTFEHIKQHRITYPLDFPQSARDLIDRLLTADPAKRLGAGGYAEIKNHVFFAGVNWTALADTPPPALTGPARAWIWPDDLAREEEARATQARDEETARVQKARDEETARATQARDTETARVQQARDTERAKWNKFLLDSEQILCSGHVIKRRNLSTKQRYLILTDHPRLFYIDPKKMEFKGEVPWTKQLRVEVKSSVQWRVETGKRTYVFEDQEKNAARWQSAVNSCLAKSRSASVSNNNTSPSNVNSK